MGQEVAQVRRISNGGWGHVGDQSTGVSQSFKKFMKTCYGLYNNTAI